MAEVDLRNSIVLDKNQDDWHEFVRQALEKELQSA